MINNQIGFIGQGFIGKHMADDFEERGYKVARYSLEEPYKNNRVQLDACQIVFIAVPTPTTPEGFDYSAVQDSLSILKSGTIAVIKSTILPGTTAALQEQFSDLIILNSPEFLREKTAKEDTAYPERNIIGIPKDTDSHKKSAELVMTVLPVAKYNEVTTSKEAEYIKYIGNAFLYTKVVFMNIMYDLVNKDGCDWNIIRDVVSKDHRIGSSHTNPIHDSGRGAGGHCFIKDFEALLQHADKTGVDKESLNALVSLRDKNNELLYGTSKDLDLLEGVYGR